MFRLRPGDDDMVDAWSRAASGHLLTAGRYDGIAPPDNSERMASAIPNAQLRVFEGGHLFLLQDPAAFPAIIEFLAS